MAFLGVTLVGGLRGQDPVPPVDPALPAQLKELKDLVNDRKMAGDFQAIGLIQQLAKEPEKRNPKDKEKIAKAIGDVFKTGKVRPADKDILYREAGDALSHFGEDGAKELAKAYENKRIKDQIPLQAHLLLALGRTEDPGQVDLLLDTATRSPHDELRAAAGEALGNYTSLDAKPRREMVKQLIREWGSLHSSATTPDPTNPNAPIDSGPQNARRTLRAVEAKWQRSLTKLTGVQNSQFADWQRWLNKNPNWPMPESPKKP
ncbi:MAG: HEAT repeat domain-containing protein [Planctomycetes bacterium]|nr:HEAT repeat domain-containing protein [Planctomycetota bacterium]